MVTRIGDFALDFGNGIVAGGKATDEVRLVEQSGLDRPEVDTVVSENAATDGAVVFGQRAQGRRATVVLDFDNSDLSRRDIQRAFSPKKVRNLTNSELLYIADEETVQASVTTGTEGPGVGGILQTFTITEEFYSTGVSFRARTHNADQTFGPDGAGYSVELVRYTDNDVTGAQYSAAYTDGFSGVGSQTSGVMQDIRADWIAPILLEPGLYSMYVSCVIDGATPTSFYAVRDTSAPYTGGVGYRDYSFDPGDGVDSTVDWWFKHHGHELVERVPASTLPYRVESAPNFESSNLHAPKRCTVTLVSENAYPLGGVSTLEVAGTTAALDFDTVTHATGTVDPYALSASSRQRSGAFGRTVFQTFTAAVGDVISDAGIEFSEGATGAFIVGLYAASAGVPVGDALRETVINGTYHAGGHVSLGGGYTVATGTEYAVVVEQAVAVNSPITQRAHPYIDGAAGYANGKGGYGQYTSGNVWLWSNTVDGDSTVDYRFFFASGTPSATSSTLVVVSDTEADAPPVITATFTGAASSLVLSDGTRTLTLTDTFANNDVVVVDCSVPSVTKNGANAFAIVELGSRFPVLAPGTTTLTANPGVALDVTWRPRYLGMV